jgi:hypothetical protein
MKKYSIYCLSLLLLFISSCDKKQNEDIVNEVPKDGSIETNISVEHLNDSTDVLITNYKVYKNSTTNKQIVKRDTIPSLGNTTVKDDKDQSQTIKKDYNIFITIK